MPKIKAGRSITVDTLCDFSEADKIGTVPAGTKRSDDSCVGKDACTPKPTLQKRLTTNFLNCIPLPFFFKTFQILNVKHHNLPYKSKLGLTTSKADIPSSTSTTNKEDTKTKPKLTLTRPKEPEFETNQRVRPTRVKNSAELEEELMAKMPKFKARPLNKKGRSAEKEKKLLVELLKKQREEERARVPIANLYPYSTDCPVIPPKPEPKQCTKPDPFQLESLVRHEEEMQKEMEERQRMEREEAEMRRFKAQPILKERVNNSDFYSS
ncbi:hypothetical protein PIB30_070345 [Stylosanthes scabra]|uniref:TPX2 central domain-containing protein n=1 Tax=Stylosanthes scabra TaxID=79078 RepID=A0ABU6XPQ3_9FABA|nr:hypothetical protein [Stylosanthes scabra]